jgi:hypothetical protein
MAKHKPKIGTDFTQGEERYTADCSCGWHDIYLWAGVEGARSAFIDHVLDTFVPVEWRAEAVERAEFRAGA